MVIDKTKCRIDMNSRQALLQCFNFSVIHAFDVALDYRLKLYQSVTYRAYIYVWNEWIKVLC